MSKENKLTNKELSDCYSGESFYISPYMALLTGKRTSSLKIFFDEDNYIEHKKIDFKVLEETFPNEKFNYTYDLTLSMEKTSFVEENEEPSDLDFLMDDDFGKSGYTVCLGQNLSLKIAKYNILLYYTDVYTEDQLRKTCVDLIAKFPKAKSENKDSKVKLVGYNNGDFYTMDSKIRSMKVDIKKNYNDDFPKEYEKLIAFIKQRESGLALMSGPAGGGKTSLLRHLITSEPADYIFITPSVASYIGNPEFIGFLQDNKNSIFILEDCEQLLRERSENTFGTSIANILNMTDGILSDIFNIKFICTFNAPEATIDPALLREGRCYFNYRFDKLKANKVAVLNKENNLGIPEDKITDMTLAELYNYKEKEVKQKKKIGF